MFTTNYVLWVLMYTTNFEYRWGNGQLLAYTRIEDKYAVEGMKNLLITLADISLDNIRIFPLTHVSL